jgi:hypothetical protein
VIGDLRFAICDLGRFVNRKSQIAKVPDLDLRIFGRKLTFFCRQPGAWRTAPNTAIPQTNNPAGSGYRGSQFCTSQASGSRFSSAPLPSAPVDHTARDRTPVRTDAHLCHAKLQVAAIVQTQSVVRSHWWAQHPEVRRVAGGPA